MAEAMNFDEMMEHGGIALEDYSFQFVCGTVKAVQDGDGIKQPYIVNVGMNAADGTKEVRVVFWNNGLSESDNIAAAQEPDPEAFKKKVMERKAYADHAKRLKLRPNSTVGVRVWNLEKKGEGKMEARGLGIRYEGSWIFKSENKPDRKVVFGSVKYLKDTKADGSPQVKQDGGSWLRVGVGQNSRLDEAGNRVYKSDTICVFDDKLVEKAYMSLVPVMDNMKLSAAFIVGIDPKDATEQKKCHIMKAGTPDEFTQYLDCKNFIVYGPRVVEKK